MGTDSDIHQTIIFDRKQKMPESAIKYFDNLSKLARLAYPELNDVAHNSITRPIFLRGLLPKIRDNLKYKEFAITHESVKTAQYFEAQLIREDLYHVTKFNFYYFSSKNETRTPDLCYMQS